MTASPVPGSPAEPATTLTAWLRARSDRSLVELLRLRPDLALPVPADSAALAARVAVRTSVQRAVDGLDAGTLRVLEDLVLAADDAMDRTSGSDENAVPADAGLPHDAADAIEALLDRALVWGDPESLHLTPSVRAAVGPHPAGLGRRAADLWGTLPPQLADPARIAAALDRLDAAEREVVDRLAVGPPVGAIRDDVGAAPQAVTRLLEARLLAPVDVRRVELPREVGRAVRSGSLRAARPELPQPEVVERTPAELDTLGTTAVLETLRLADALATAWTATPPPTLRAGGLGVRELRRTARELDTDETTVTVLAETMAAAGLLGPTNTVDPVLLPTTTYDDWCARPAPRRWTALAGAWLTMTRQPSLVGSRGERDRVITALGPDAERGTLPALRRQALGLLTELAPGAAPADREDVLTRFAWHQPRRAGALLPVVEAVLDEAELLGLTAAGGLTGYTRTLLAGATSAAEHALDAALPAPVDHVLAQPDLTLVVPGPPAPDLAPELAVLADLESTGGASVYRVTERTVRRALDAGRTGPQLHELLATRSRTPVPQALTYLIDDAARRHGVLRTGVAGAYLRCDDESLLDRVLADRATDALGLQRIAPTVVISPAGVADLLATLREAGFAPAAESPDGAVVTLDVEPRRAPARPAARPAAVRGPDGEARLTDAVRRLRSGDALAGADSRVQMIARDVPGVYPASTMELLRRAVREERSVWFGCAEADGTSTAHTLQPISLAAGTVRGYEAGRPGLASYPVHRITAIRLLEADDDGDGRLDVRDEAAGR